ncbi:hypothetical protein ACFL2V_21840 [Pseudomonadota bacterium]
MSNREFILLVLKFFYPQQKTWIVKTLVLSGIGIICRPFWEPILIGLLNTNFGSELNIPDFDWAGWILLVTGIIIFSINQWHQRTDAKLRKGKALPLVGNLLNEVINCWDLAAMNAKYAQSIRPDILPRMYKNMEISSYLSVKSELMPYNVFKPKEWKQLDYLVELMNDSNKFISNGSIHLLPVQLAHLADYCETVKNSVSDKYVDLGGSINEVYFPTIASYERY